MTDKDYEELADALQTLCDSSNWRKSISSIRNYLRNPGKPFSASVSPHTRLLVDFGRKNPEALERLLTLVFRIRRHEFDLETYMTENKEKIDKAFEILNKMDRPMRTINSFMDIDGAAAKRRVDNLRGEMAVLEVLIPIAKASMTRFRQLVDIRLFANRERMESAREEYLKVYSRRRVAQNKLFRYLNHLQYNDELSDKQKQAFKEITSEASHAAGLYAQKYSNENMSKSEAREKFWQEYDRDLSSTIRILEAEKKGAKIVRENIRFPRIVDKLLEVEKRTVKLQKLQSRFKK